MASIEELRAERMRKLNILKERGIDPYPSTSGREYSLAETVENFDKFVSEDKKITIAGRLMAQRGQGALLFTDISDGTARFQCVLKKDDIDEAVFQLFIDTVDIGDFVEFSVKVFVTKR